MRRLGIGYRHRLGQWLADDPPNVGCLEITAEHFFDGGEQVLQDLSEKCPLFVHGLGLSLGTPGPLDASTLANFAKVATAARAHWVSEHVAFTRTAEVDLGHLNPVPMNLESLAIVADHAIEIAERCSRPLILENITSDFLVSGFLTETEFLNRLCTAANCGLLLDVTNLFINSKNHGYDALAWLHEVDPKNIAQLHVVGYSRRDGRYCDHHSATIQPELMDLVQAVLEYAPVSAIILERDERLEEVEEISSELQRLQNVIELHRSDHDDRATAQ